MDDVYDSIFKQYYENIRKIKEFNKLLINRLNFIINMDLKYYDKIIKNIDKEQLTSYIIRATSSMNNNLLKK